MAFESRAWQSIWLVQPLLLVAITIVLWSAPEHISAFTSPSFVSLTSPSLRSYHGGCRNYDDHQLQNSFVSFETCAFSSSSSIWSSRLRVVWLSSSKDDDDGTAADDGAEFAAAFFRAAQSKGINIDSADLLYDDDDEEEENDIEDDDDDDDDETEPNIPQGAINAFLGYDTGNVGEKLAGNVTLTNDQLYSEVKERVLESAGGFVSFVKGANDDEDDDDEDEDDEDRQLIAGTNKPYVVPTTVPDSELTAGEVVLLVLEALRNNDTPTKNKGVEILFGYSSPGSQIKNEVGLTPTEYAEFLKETEYKVLFTNGGPIHIDKADYSFDGKKAFFTARLPISVQTPLDTVSVNFILSTTGREDDACWLIDSILIRPQSMRRRRRK